MPSKHKTEDLTVDEPPNSIDPYAVLDIGKSATADQVKTAYRKAALKWHPDKAPSEGKDTAHKKFQEVAFAYAILSDAHRRARYDATGRTEESLDDADSDFNWRDFFRTQFDEVVSSDSIARFRAEYQHSEEERLAVLAAYEVGEGDMERVYEEVMLSNPLEDEERFRGVIDEAVGSGEVKRFKKYAEESEKDRKRRMKKARAEAEEAAELARELGVEDKLFGAGGGNGSATKSKAAADDGEAALKALIQQRQKGREANFLADLEAKYAPKGKKGRKRAEMEDEPPEEAFQKTAARAKKARSRKTSQRCDGGQIGG